MLGTQRRVTWPQCHSTDGPSSAAPGGADTKYPSEGRRGGVTYRVPQGQALARQKVRSFSSEWDRIIKARVWQVWLRLRVTIFNRGVPRTFKTRST